MLTIFADNTMILGSIADRQDAQVVTTSTIMRGIARLAARLLRAVEPVVVGVTHAYCVPCPATSCPSFANTKRWQLDLSGLKKPLGQGSPVGSGRLIAG